MPEVPERKLSYGELQEAKRLQQQPRKDSLRFRQLHPPPDLPADLADVPPEDFLPLHSDPFYDTDEDD